MYKKITVLFIVLSLVVSMAACGNQSQENQADDEIVLDDSTGIGDDDGADESSDISADDETEESEDTSYTLIIEETDENSSDSSSDNDSSGKTGMKQLVADSLDSIAIEPEGAGAMDLLYYAIDEMDFESSGSDDYTHRSFSGEADGYDVLEAYVETLCSEYDFQLAGDPYYQEYKSAFFDFVLTYTGSETMTGGGIDGVYSGITGDIMIYGTIERDDLDGCIYYDTALELVDGGYRYGSSSGGNTLVGESVGSGLYRLEDGSYQTSDERLTAAVGEAMMITDGNESSLSAEFVMNNDDGNQEVYVKNSYGTTLLKFYVPATLTMETGQIFTEYEFVVDSSDQTVKKEGIFSDLPPFTWTTMFACAHDGDYVVPVRGMTGEMTRVNVRVMYVEEENEAVFYFCTQFKNSPNEIEGLIAVSIGADTVVENQPDGEYTISAGESMDITGPSEFDALHNLWTWEYLEGSGYSELTGTTSQTCTLKGLKAGDVRIKVTYDYSVKEEDVLTGNPRTVQKVSSQEFVIHIVD